MSKLKNGVYVDAESNVVILESKKTKTGKLKYEIETDFNLICYLEGEVPCGFKKYVMRWPNSIYMCGLTYIGTMI